MANWSLPTLSDLYVDFLTYLKNRDTDLALMFDGTSSTNVPTNAVGWNSTNSRFEKYNGTSWDPLDASYEINVISLGGQIASYYTNASNLATGTLPAARFTDVSHGNRGGGTLHSNAVASVSAGFMTGADKAKLDVIEPGATADQTPNEILTAIKTVDGVTSGLDADLLDGQEGTYYATAAGYTINRVMISNGAGTLTVHSSTTDTELGYLTGVTSAIQTQLNGKQATITGAATSIVSSNLALSKALASDATGKVAVATTTLAELNFLSGVTSSVQTQLGTKAPTVSPTLTGTPLAPTATGGTNTTQIATTAFVQGAVSGLAGNYTMQVFTASGTYTKPAGISAIEITCVGGGGGGRATINDSLGPTLGGCGGGAAIKRVAAASVGSTVSVTIGSGGAGGHTNNGPGGTGGTSSFGAHCSATGGTTGGETGGGIGSSGDINIKGDSGFRVASEYSFSGGSIFGGSQLNTYISHGAVGVTYGSGGVGGFGSTSGFYHGGAGKSGIVIIREYY